MLRNYLVAAWRNLRKNPSFSLINMIGLASGMAICLLVMLIIADQENYDQFHRNKDRIYRVQMAGKAESMNETASSALPLAREIKNSYTGVEVSASLVKQIGGDILYQNKIAAGGGYFADKNLFGVMDFSLEEGNPATALEDPFSLVISKEIAEQLFKNENALGKNVRFTDKGINPAGPEVGNKEVDYGTFTITGVLKNNPGKTSLPFQLLGSLSTLNALNRDSILNYPMEDWTNIWSCYTYVLMQPGKSKADLQQILDNIAAKKYNTPKGTRYAFHAENLEEIMPGKAIGNATNTALPRGVLLFLGILCTIIILSACLNYTNLSLARSLSRAKEVGIRKVSGASRKQVFAQFITESILMSFISLVMAICLLTLLQPLFAGLWLNRFFNISFSYDGNILLIFLGFSLLVGLIAGLLPAMYISLFQPIQIFKNASSIKIFKGLTIRKVLLVIQFSVSLIFIVSAILVYNQTSHVFNFDYGFNKDNVINVKLYRPENHQRFAQAIRANPDIVAVGACSFPPSSGTQNGTMVYKANNLQDSLQTSYFDIAQESLEVWDIKLVAGKTFPEIPAAQEERYVLINEKMVSAFHFTSSEAAVGQPLLIDGKSLEILGVVKDFQFLEVNRGIAPLVLRNRAQEFGYTTVRTKASAAQQSLSFMQEAWKKVNPQTKFEYAFFDTQLRFLHSMMKDAASIIGFLALMAVVVACLGLLGMAVYTAETRQKEVGVRKVLGSSGWQVMVLLSKNYVLLLSMAIVIAIPIAYLLNNIWLQFFVSRVKLGFPVFILGTGVLLLISLTVVFSQAWRVSRINPVKSLRLE